MMLLTMVMILAVALECRMRKTIQSNLTLILSLIAFNNAFQ